MVGKCLTAKFTIFFSKVIKQNLVQREHLVVYLYNNEKVIEMQLEQTT